MATQAPSPDRLAREALILPERATVLAEIERLDPDAFAGLCWTLAHEASISYAGGRWFRDRGPLLTALRMYLAKFEALFPRI